MAPCIPAIPGPATSRPPVAILGVPFHAVTMAEALGTIEAMIASGQPHHVVTANVDFLVQARTDIELRKILFDAHLVLCDGTPVLWASRLLGNPLPERVAGADLAPLLLRVAAEKGYRVFFLGAAPESSARAVARLRAQMPDLQIAGYYSPPFRPLHEMNHASIQRRILEARPDLLFVSFGCPKQEKWIAMHYQDLGVPVTAGVGATIDFLAGQMKRAPAWARRSGLEWVFRLCQEPRRLFRRYVKDLWVFSRSLAAQLWLMRWSRAKAARGSCAPAEGIQMTSARPAQDSARQIFRFPARLDDAAIAGDPSLVCPPPHYGRPCFLDLAGVKAIDSAGIGLLIQWQKALRAAGCRVALLAPGAPVRKALAFMRVEPFFIIAPDVRSGLKLFRERARAPVSHEPASKEAALARVFWQGEITAANAREVWNRTRNELAFFFGTREWTVDLSRVRFMDSAGVRLMLRLKRLAQRRGLSLGFAGFGPAVRNVLRLAGCEEAIAGSHLNSQ